MQWRATYSDGSNISQYNPEGSENRYQDIDRSRLIRFDLLNDDNKVIHCVFLREDQQLIYRRRTLLVMGKEQAELLKQGGELTKENAQQVVVVFLVGWQMQVETPDGIRSIKAINYIYEDGSIALDGDRNNLQLLDIEK